tara:strand:+ start:2036 stop:2464 length:429 start_codon:yes stop_codon:yes gene_type:complete
MKNKFQDFLIDEENKELCKKMTDKFEISEKRCFSIIEYLRMMDKLTEKNLENAIHVLNVKNRNVKENKIKKNIKFLEKMSDDSRKKSFEIHRKYRNIFENFVQAKNGKCPDGFEYNKSLGGCMPVGPKLNNLDFPLDGDLSK